MNMYNLHKYVEPVLNKEIDYYKFLNIIDKINIASGELYTFSYVWEKIEQLYDVKRAAGATYLFKITKKAKKDMAYSTLKENAESSYFNKKTAPEHFVNKTAIKYKSMPIQGLKEIGMWNNRLDKLIPHLSKDVWIAGGFLRSILAGDDELDGDIDFFFGSEEGFNRTYEAIKTGARSRDSKNVFVFYTTPECDLKKTRVVEFKSLAEFRPNIQLIKLYWFDNPQHVIDSFDFTVCQLITDGKTLYYHPNTLEDVEKRRISLHRATNDPCFMLNRLLKYENKQYKYENAVFKEVEGRVLKILESPKIIEIFKTDEEEASGGKTSYLKHLWNYLEATVPGKYEEARARQKKHGEYFTYASKPITIQGVGTAITHLTFT